MVCEGYMNVCGLLDFEFFGGFVPIDFVLRVSYKKGICFVVNLSG